MITALSIQTNKILKIFELFCMSVTEYFFASLLREKKLYFTQEPDDARYEKLLLPWSGYFTAGKTTSLSMR